MGDSDRAARVEHPILRLEVVQPDGTRTAAHRVYCLHQRRSVEAEACSACVHCDAITADPAPIVACTIPASRATLEPDPVGEHTDVGAVLRGTMVTLAPTASLRDALDVLRAEGQCSLSVVDGGGTMVGVLHEASLQRTEPGIAEVASRMSSALALHERTTVRRALRMLASAHLREVAVVDAAGAPIGVFRDIDGLRFLALGRARSRADG